MRDRETSQGAVPAFVRGREPKPELAPGVVRPGAFCVVPGENGSVVIRCPVCPWQAKGEVSPTLGALWSDAITHGKTHETGPA
jgi:hypothetical protein